MGAPIIHFPGYRYEISRSGITNNWQLSAAWDRGKWAFVSLYCLRGVSTKIYKLLQFLRLNLVLKSIWLLQSCVFCTRWSKLFRKS